MTLQYHTPLSPQTQLALGIDPPAPLAMADQVKFSELDALNHVNNAVYLHWFERVRVKYAQERGIAQFVGSEQEPRIVIRSAQMHYRQEMLMNEDYVVTCGCTGFRKTSFTLSQTVWSGATLRATFDCVLVLLHPDGSGRFPLPKGICDEFVRIDGATPDS